jgi:uncharacterized membrane protein YdjX (TVP38/TMEM64 family)
MFMRRLKAGKLLTILAYPLFLTAILLAGFIFRSQLLDIFSTPEQLKSWIRASGILAPLAFVAAQAFQVIVFFIPGEVPQIAGGYLFGVWSGSALSALGILLGSTVSFLLSRFLGVPFVYALFPPGQVDRVRRVSGSSRAKMTFFLFFLIPGIPKDILCYVAGLTPIRLPIFLLLSTLGRLPGILGSALMGDAAAEQRWILAGLLFAGSALLFILGFALRTRIQELLERISAGRR